MRTPLNLRPTKDDRIIDNDSGRYIGMVFFYKGYGWTHSLQSFGAEPFATSAAALADFSEVKAHLPASIHKRLFGKE